MSPLSRMTGKAEGQPVDRLGRIAAAMLKAGEQHPECREDDRVIVMLDNASDGKGLICHGGYDEDESAEAFVNLLAHVQVLAESRGLKLDFVPYAPARGQG
jgi:hypothetical protein